MINQIELCLEFFKRGKPNPTPKDFSTQLGVHFEEVREMVIELIPTNPHVKMLLDRAESSLHNLAEHLKLTEGGVTITNNRMLYLDALCDQIVTAIGCGHMSGMDVNGAMNEVNTSNLSKFDDSGNPIVDANGKLMKGPNYRKADLSSFV